MNPMRENRSVKEESDLNLLELINTWTITYRGLAAPFSLLCVGYVTVKLARAFWFSEWVNKPITFFKKDHCWECHKVVNANKGDYYLFEPTLEVLCKSCCDKKASIYKGRN